MSIHIKRVYDRPSVRDGRRVLVDRVWPRGVKKERAGVDLWLKEVAPSTELRKWFGHDASRWAEFCRRYRAELDRKRQAVDRLRTEMDQATITLLYSARDEQHNNAVVLKEYLEA